MKLGATVDPRLPWIRKLSDLDEARAVGTPGPRLEALRRAGRALGDRLRNGPRVLGVKTLNNAVLPYPTRFAFNGVVPLPWPMVIMTHRTLLVQLRTSEGVKNVLFNPTDAQAARQAPFFAKLEAQIKKIAPFAEKLHDRHALAPLLVDCVLHARRHRYCAVDTFEPATDLIEALVAQRQELQRLRKP